MIKNPYITVLFFCLNILQMPSFPQGHTLEHFIKQGLIHSPVLKDINNQVNSNAIDSLLIKAGQKPQVSYNGLLYYAPVINGMGYSETITDISNLTSVFYVTQRIFNQKNILGQYSKIGIQNESLRNTARITEKDMIKAISQQYLSACSVSNDITFNRDLLASSKEEELILKQMVERGLYRQVDYLSFMVELKAQELMLYDLQIQYQKEISSLRFLCGLSDTLQEQLALPEIKINSPLIPVYSPLFTRFVLDSLKIENEKSLIDQNYKPSINWFSDAGLLNNLPRDLNKNFGFSIGLRLSIPIYDGHQRKLNYDKLRIAENSRMNYAVYFKQQFSQQLHQLHLELRELKDIIPQARQQLDFAESVVKQEKLLMNSGNISITDYVTALKNYISVKHNLNQYEVRIRRIITEINYLN